MAGQKPELCSRRLAYALDKLSKNTLIDIIADLAVMNVGEEGASDEELAGTIQAWVDPVLRVRSGRRIDLAAQMAIFDSHEERYRKKTDLQE